MTFGQRSLHRAVLRTGAAVLALLVALHGINGATADVRFFSLDQEGSLPSWIRILLFFVAACVCAMAAYDGNRTVWLGLAGALAVFSLDDYVEGHEWLETQTDASTFITVVEPAAALAFVVLVAVACRRLPRTQSLLVVAGSALFLVGFAAAAANDDRSDAVTVGLSTIEQVCEAAFGWCVLAAALAPALDALARWAAGRGARVAPGVADRAEDPPVLVT